MFRHISTKNHKKSQKYIKNHKKSEKITKTYKKPQKATKNHKESVGLIKPRNALRGLRGLLAYFCRSGQESTGSRKLKKTAYQIKQVGIFDKLIIPVIRKGGKIGLKALDVKAYGSACVIF